MAVQGKSWTSRKWNCHQKQGLQSSPIKLANASLAVATSTHYECELEAIKLGTDLIVGNIRKC